MKNEICSFLTGSLPHNGEVKTVVFLLFPGKSSESEYQVPFYKTFKKARRGLLEDGESGLTESSNISPVYHGREHNAL